MWNEPTKTRWLLFSFELCLPRSSLSSSIFSFGNCYFLLNYAWGQAPRIGGCMLCSIAIFFWIMLFYGAWRLYIFPSGGVIAIFFWIMRLGVDGMATIKVVYREIAIFFWIMLPPVTVSNFSVQHEPANCYFLLNYASSLLVSKCVSSANAALLFSFELCPLCVNRGRIGDVRKLYCYFLLNYAHMELVVPSTKRNTRIILLFSFELCSR